MLYSSDYSSEEEEYENGNQNAWNPTEVLDELSQTQDPLRKTELRTQLLTSFLDQQRPILSSRMKEFLQEEGMVQILVSFLLRWKEELPVGAYSSSGQRSLMGEGDELKVLRSYRLMELFHNPMIDLVEILQPNLQAILSEMFKIVEKNSLGNFYHFHKILMRFLNRCPLETTSYLLSSELIWKLLDVIHEPAVADSLLGFFCISFPKHSDTLAFYKSVVDLHIHDKIGSLIYGPGNFAKSVYASDFFIRLLEKLSSQDLSANLFISLCRTSDFLDGLFNAIVVEDSTFSESQKLGCANVLKELLLKSGEKAMVQHAFARPIPNMLAAIHNKLHELSAHRVKTISDVLVSRYSSPSWCLKELELPSFQVKKPLGVYLFTLIEIMANLILVNPSHVSQISAEGWRVLSSWFFEYSFNNLYHSMFVKVFRALLAPAFEEEQRQLLQKQKFLSRLLEQFKKGDSGEIKIGNRGFIIIIANMIRLTFDSLSPHSLIHQFLNSHDNWKLFIPTLRELTTVQLVPYQDLEEEDQDLSIDLGSAYAKSIGMNLQPFAGEIKKKKKKKKKKTNAETPTTPTEEESQQDSQSQEEAKKMTSWWTDLTATLESDAPKEEDKSDWWKDLKEELNQLPSTPSPTDA